jgi:hypothetical protein
LAENYQPITDQGKTTLFSVPCAPFFADGQSPRKNPKENGQKGLEKRTKWRFFRGQSATSRRPRADGLRAQRPNTPDFTYVETVCLASSRAHGPDVERHFHAS